VTSNLDEKTIIRIEKIIVMILGNLAFAERPKYSDIEKVKTTNISGNLICA
jgi:hypothetical protein